MPHSCSEKLTGKKTGICSSPAGKDDSGLAENNDSAVACGSTPVNNTQTLCRLHRQQVQGAANLHRRSIQMVLFNQLTRFSYQNHQNLREKNTICLLVSEAIAKEMSPYLMQLGNFHTVENTHATKCFAGVNLTKGYQGYKSE